MNFCPQAEKIIDYCLNQLTDEERKEFQTHLESCKICQRELALEMAIENELAQEFDPGFVENRIKVRLQLQQERDMRSFWLYAFRMAVYGISAAIAGFVLIPLLSRFIDGSVPDLSQYTHGFAEMLGNLAPGNTIYIVLGFCYIAVFIASMFSLAQIRR
jgi:anti-sigma factor RsiW